MSTQGTATLDFGAGALEATLAITGQAGITTANLVEAWPVVQGDSSPWVEQMTVYAGDIVNGTGFTIIAKPALGRAFGTYPICWVWN